MNKLIQNEIVVCRDSFTRHLQTYLLRFQIFFTYEITPNLDSMSQLTDNFYLNLNPNELLYNSHSQFLLLIRTPKPLNNTFFLSKIRVSTSSIKETSTSLSTNF